MNLSQKQNFKLSMMVVFVLAMVGGIVTIVSNFKSESVSIANTTTEVIPDFVSATGYIEPKGEVIRVASAATDGRVEQLLVKRGQSVKARETIAILDNRDRRKATLKQAQAKVAIAKAKLARVEAGAKQGEIAAQDARFERAKAELNGQIDRQRATIASLEAQLQGETSVQKANITRVKAELVNAEAECKRYQTLYAEGAVSISNQEQVCLQAQTSREQVREASANLDRIITTQTQNITEAKAELARTIATVNRQIEEAEAELTAVSEIRPEDIALAQAELQEAQAELQQAQANLDLAYIKAPSDGTILEIHTLPGEIVSNDGIVELGQTEEMFVVAEVYESDIARVKIGQTVTVSSNGILDGQLTGKVVEKGWLIGTRDILGTDPVADIDSRVVRVKISLDPSDSDRVKSLSNLEVYVTIDTSNS